MSLDVRWLTNGEKKVYTVRDAVAETFNVYANLADVPHSVRHYAESIKDPTFCEPDLARYFGVQNILYPGWPKMCGHPSYKGQKCIAEMCKYAEEAGGWSKCPYFPKEAEQ